ncbi:MAG TPA: carboxypeptidase-like regulatory domain-containing protein [Polyangiales bacterium]|nr:carboxypeptidase-like regulatory domain-containing protein [Polyangiales bacterium]
MPNAKLALVIVLGGLVAACFSANRPLDSTQTGNPPVIKTDRVALHLSSSDVRVIGEPGAVEPGGAKVEVINLTTGMSFTTQAAPDGSFDVEVSGSANDAYSVRAKAGSKTSSPVFVIRGTAAVGDGTDGSLSCQQRYSLAGELLKQASEAADRSCNVDADCEALLAEASCYVSGCVYAYVSERGRTQIERVSRDIDANLCAEYAADGCTHTQTQCMPPAAAVCQMGQCGTGAPDVPQEPEPSCNSLSLRAGKLLDDAHHAADQSCMVDSDCVREQVRLSCREDCTFVVGFSQAGAAQFESAYRKIEAEECSQFKALGCRATEPDCEESQYDIACVQNVCTTRPRQQDPLPDCVVCLNTYLQWHATPSGALVTDTSTLASCATYQRHRVNRQTGEESSCETKLVACNAITSTGAISTALAHPDVQTVLNYPENPVKLGNTRTGDVFQMTIGMRQLELGGSCEGAPPDCAPVPPGVEALRKLLQEIDQAFSEPMGACAGLKP